MANLTAPAEDENDNGSGMLLWLLVWSELTIFGILLCGFLISSVSHADVFAAVRPHLAARIAGMNTVVLLASGWQAALASNSDSNPRLQRLFLLLAAALGFLFVTLKFVEYRHEWPLASEEDFGSFFELYFLLTGFHLAHVGFVAVLFILVAMKPKPTNVAILTTIWHVIDLVWLVMFPLIYLG